MNANEIRWNLHNFDNLKQEIKQLQLDLDEYRKMDISGIKAQVITDMPLTHESTSKTEKMALTRVEYIQRLENELDAKIRLVRAINGVYFYLREPKRSLIEMRYFIHPQGRHKYSWYEISVEVNTSEENCKKIDGRIINLIQAKLLESVTFCPLSNSITT